MDEDGERRVRITSSGTTEVSSAFRMNRRSRLKVGLGFRALNTMIQSNVFKANIILLVFLSLPASGKGLHPPHCEWSVYQDIERLNCRVDAGNNLIVEEEVNGVGPENAKSLWVDCGRGSDNVNNVESFADTSLQSDDYFQGGSARLSNPDMNSDGHVLSHGVFMAVQNLRDLKLENCRITGITPGALSYLPYLRNLTIRARTSLTWPSSASLDIKPGVFRGLNELRHLDLSTTSLTSLPNDFLCFLPALNSLNLSSCWLRDFRSIGIIPSDPTNPHNCGAYVQTLDLSSNHFTLLPPATFASVTNLEELRIDMNSITMAAERALLGLSQLKIVSLSGNQLTSLPPEFFKDNRQLKEIYLQNNSLSVLAPGLFSGLEHLVVLDLSNNELTSEWVNGETGTFRGLVRLVILNLANNDLTKIDPILLRDLASLQVLNLENNKIASIADDGFSGMFNVHSLLLSHNQLPAVDKFICNGLFVLSFLAIDNNKIEQIQADSFKNCSNLVDLNLSGNKLTTVPAAISPLTQLKTLDLGENKISDISNASYQNLGSLYGLRLTDNSIRTVPSNAFLNLPSLKIINLAKNNITSVEPGAFDNSVTLQAVRLDSNSLSSIAGLFKNIPNLLFLNFSGNSLEELHYEDLPPKLQWLDLRSNKIRTLGNCLDVEKLRIRNLDLSQNLLVELGSSNLPDSIENLVLSHNKISNIQPYTFFRKPNLTRVDLSHNNLVKLDQNAFRLSPDRSGSNSGQVAELLLGNNPLQCDCTMEWLQNMSNEIGHYPLIQDVEDVKCSLSFDRRMYEPISYLRVDASQFLCKYESHCFSLCSCCDFDACDCEMTCPKNCSCFHDQAWGTNVVDCSMNDQTIIPGRIPMDVTELYLDGNILPSLDSHSFIGRKNLRSLYLNSSHVEIIHNRTFHGLRALRVLHLENNFLERLEGFEFEDLDGLEALYLQHNSILWISNLTFIHMTQLKILYLHGNNFVDLPIWRSLASVRLSLQELTLRGNEWSCDCHFTMEFKDWLIENRAKITDANLVQCVDQVTGNQKLNSSVVLPASAVSHGQRSQSFQSSELIVVRLLDGKNHKCSQITDLSVLEPSSGEHSGDMRDYVVLVITLASVLVLIIIVIMIAFYWRQSLKVWFHAQCGLRLGTCSEHPSDRDKLFDAFVSYSSKDEAWVRQVLAAELERNDPPYRLCLRYRDLPTGGTYLADTIVQASEASRRTVLVLSHHFLKGEWGRTDVKSAHHSVLKDRSRKVIIILLGDLPSKDLDPDIRLYLKNHTYLNCEDKRFWQKLRYALPDVKAKAPLSRGMHSRASNSSNHIMRNHAPPPPPPPPLLNHPHFQNLAQQEYTTQLQQQQLLHQHQQLYQQQQQQLAQQMQQMHQSTPPMGPSPQNYHLTANGMTPQNNLNSLLRNGSSGRGSVNRAQRHPSGNNSANSNRHVAIHI